MGFTFIMYNDSNKLPLCNNFGSRKKHSESAAEVLLRIVFQTLEYRWQAGILERFWFKITLVLLVLNFSLQASIKYSVNAKYLGRDFESHSK